MALTQTITNSSQLFHDLKAMGRDNFTYNGAVALQEYLEELSEDIGDIDYDPIAFCCEWSEYGGLVDFNEQYNSSDPFDTWDEVRENTTVIEFAGGFIVGDF